MSLVPNIGRGGRLIRAASGVACVFAAAFLVLSSWPPSMGRLAGAVLLFVLGVFQIIEGTIGWCAVRAMGRKTPF